MDMKQAIIRTMLFTGLVLQLIDGYEIPSIPPSRPPFSSPPSAIDRRSVLLQSGAGVLLGSGLLLPRTPAQAITSTSPRRHTVDYSTFQKKLFNKPPGLLQYPSWMEGEWVVNCKFIGADFPSSSAKVSPYIPKDRIVDDTSLPGFRRLSIAMVPDVGKTEGHQYNMRFIKKDDEGGSDRVEEDKAFNLKQALESELGNSAVTGIEYNPDKNPNRASINLLPNVSPNAQRIELFWNARSTLPPQQGEEELESFRYVEDIRQVLITPQLQETTTVGDYRHVWELYPLDDGTRTIKGYLSTVVYATPQDPLFQSGPFAPLVVFFHTLTYKPSTAK